MLKACALPAPSSNERRAGLLLDAAEPAVLKLREHRPEDPGAERSERSADSELLRLGRDLEGLKASSHFATCAFPRVNESCPFLGWRDTWSEK